MYTTGSFVPGLEYAGVVESVGGGKDMTANGLKPGDKVQKRKRRWTSEELKIQGGSLLARGAIEWRMDPPTQPTHTTHPDPNRSSVSRASGPTPPTWWCPSSTAGNCPRGGPSSRGRALWFVGFGVYVQWTDVCVTRFCLSNQFDCPDIWFTTIILFWVQVQGLTAWHGLVELGGCKPGVGAARIGFDSMHPHNHGRTHPHKWQPNNHTQHRRGRPSSSTRPPGAWGRWPLSCARS